jgi:DNA-binding CsgD family transcriptional regulator
VNVPSVDVLRDIAAGYSMRETAERAGITEDMIKYHLRIWRERLGARNTTHAVALAVAQGALGAVRTECDRCIRTRLVLAGTKALRDRTPPGHIMRRLHDQITAVHATQEKP